MCGLILQRVCKHGCGELYAVDVRRSMYGCAALLVRGKCEQVVSVCVWTIARSCCCGDFPQAPTGLQHRTQACHTRLWSSHGQLPSTVPLILPLTCNPQVVLHCHSQGQSCAVPLVKFTVTASLLVSGLCHKVLGTFQLNRACSNAVTSLCGSCIAAFSSSISDV